MVIHIQVRCRSNSPLQVMTPAHRVLAAVKQSFLELVKYQKIFYHNLSCQLQGLES